MPLKKIYEINIAKYSLLSLCLTSYAQTWELQKNEGGIKVWTRPSGRAMDDSKVTALIKADMDDVLDALMDPLTYPKWQPKAGRSLFYRSQAVKQNTT